MPSQCKGQKTGVDAKLTYSSPKLIAGTLPQPIVDYPQATTRTAVDLILTRTFTADSKFKVILSHAGGTTPWLADRISVGSMAAGANFMPPADV